MKPEDIARFLDIPIDTVEDTLEPTSVDDITSTQHAQEVYESAFPGSEAERLAIMKWLSLCTTSEEAKKVYDVVPQSTEAEGFAMVKWNELSLEEVQQATTCKQIKEAFNNASSCSEARFCAIRKLAEMPDEE